MLCRQQGLPKQRRDSECRIRVETLAVCDSRTSTDLFSQRWPNDATNLLSAEYRFGGFLDETVKLPAVCRVCMAIVLARSDDKVWRRLPHLLTVPVARQSWLSHLTRKW